MITLYRNEDDVLVFDSRIQSDNLKETRSANPDKVCVEGDGFEGSILVDGVIVPAETAIEDRLTAKILEIDVQARQQIRAGFTYDGATFSLSAAAQANWTGLLTAHNAGFMTFPVAVSTIDDNEYLVQDVQFFAAAFNHVSNILQTGRLLKTSAKNSRTPEDIEV